MLEIGSDAPDFELKNQDSESVKLSEFKGKVVVLYFYPKDNTPGCTTEACDFRDSMDSLKKYGIVVLGVSSDSVNSHKKFHDQKRLNFNILSDQKKEVIKMYGADGPLFTRRITYIIDKNQKVAHLFDKVHPQGHSREVLEKINELHLL
ncbi:MAG: peroxiredoxin [Conexivisphaerales archaeon]